MNEQLERVDNNAQNQKIENWLKPKDDSRFAELGAIAKAVAFSGYFKDFDQRNAQKGAAQALVKILRGQDLGISPMASVEGIYMIENRTACSVHIMSGLIRRSGASFDIIKHTDQECEIEFIDESGNVLGTAGYNTAMARRAGLMGRNVWQKYPEDMLYARAMSRGFRRFFSDLAMGGLFTPEELGAQISEPNEAPSREDAHTALYESVEMDVEDPHEKAKSDGYVRGETTHEAVLDTPHETLISHVIDGDEIVSTADGTRRKLTGELIEEDDSYLDDIQAELEWLGYEKRAEILQNMCAAEEDGNWILPAYEGVSDVPEALQKKVLGLMRRARGRLHGARLSDEEAIARIVSFYDYVLKKEYVISSTKMLDDARSEFLTYEKEQKENAKIPS